MKFKPLNKEDSIIESTRYNKNVEGKHIGITHSFGSQDKRNFAALCMLGIMSKTEDFDRITKNDNDSRLIDVIHKMIDNANQIVDKTFLKDDGKRVL
ncbi:MAG: hypothetical protein IKR57_06220 [Bacilli bacterium]|nr:hypothetical protein [Bacilli bacterium]